MVGLSFFLIPSCLANTAFFLLTWCGWKSSISSIFNLSPILIYPAFAASFNKSKPFLVLTIAALNPSSSPLGDPPLQVSKAAISELSPIASGHI